MRFWFVLHLLLLLLLLPLLAGIREAFLQLFFMMLPHAAATAVVAAIKFQLLLHFSHTPQPLTTTVRRSDVKRQVGKAENAKWKMEQTPF